MGTQQTEPLDNRALKGCQQRLSELNDEKSKAAQCDNDILYQELELGALTDMFTKALGLLGTTYIQL